MERTKLNFTLICFAFIIHLSFKQHITKAQLPTFVSDDCIYSKPQSLTDNYQTNLNNIITYLTSNSATSKGYNYTTIGNKGDAVYGLYDCRGDIVGLDCQVCVTAAAREVPDRCPNRVSATIFYSFCLLKFSNESFFGKVITDPTWQRLGPKNVSSVVDIQKGLDFMKGLITKATNETNQLYYRDGFNLSSSQKRYGLVQCRRDLNNTSCRQCLDLMLDNVPKCCEHKLGWQVSSASCLIRYDDYIFFVPNDQSLSPASDQQTGKNSNKSRNLIIGFSVLGSIVLLFSAIYCLWYKNRVKKDWLEPEYEETLNADLPTIPLITIQHCTDNFSETSKLGEGGFGSVYKGILPDGREIAVKRLSKNSGQGSEEFKNEVMFIAKLQHSNLVRLLACCLEGNEKLLVYEFMPNASLDFHLFDNEKRKELNWKQSLSIINGIAKGILYLHEDSRLRVIHRDLKASNVLLDHEMNPKISDFGLARAFEDRQNHANTRRIMGTYGYMAPEYAMEGVFSVKSDVFSFGVLVLEIISGKKNTGFYRSEHGQSLLLYAWNKWCEGKCLELMDSMLEKTYIENEVVRCINIGLLCVQEDAADRPTMSSVVVMLASDTMTLSKPKQPAFSIGRMTSNDTSNSNSSKEGSINDVTVTDILPR